VSATAAVVAVVVVEPLPWLPSLLERVAPGRHRVVLAPLVPLALRAAMRAWARADAWRRMRLRFAAREAADRLAARKLPAGTRLVVAPSGAAERTFAAARAKGIATLLVQDLPLLRHMHEDLDAAARRHPDAPFLWRFRASAGDVARQEVERVLADRVVVRGHHAWRGLLADGVDEARLLVGDDVHASERRTPPAGPTRLLLAGLATTRNGTRETLAALAGRPDVELLVHAGEGLDPPDLLRRPGVRLASDAERRTLRGVHAVLAPAWCESYAPEVNLAARLGVPLVASARAARHVDLARAGAEVAPGDAAGLRVAIDALIERPRAD
jgi:hypothetical protein